MMNLCTAGLILAASASATSVSHRRVMEQGITAAPSPLWTRGNRCSAEDENLQLMVMLELSKTKRDALEKIFWEVSSPDDSNYGKHLSMEALVSMVGSTDARIATVKAWLERSGAVTTKVGQTRDSIKVTMPCAAAELAFSTEIHRFQHTSLTGASLLRATSAYSLPVEIAAHVAMVGDLVLLPAPSQMKIAADVDAGAGAPFPSALSCNGKCGHGNFVTPGVLTQAYTLGDSPKTAKGSMAVAEFQGVMWDAPALAKFSSTCALTPAVNVTHQVGKDNGIRCEIPVLGTQACAEAMLDIEYIGAVGGAIPLTDIYSAQFSLLGWAQTVLDLPNGTIPLVHSISYGNDEVQQKSVDFMYQVNTAFIKLGALGVSVLVAAGDQGVEGRSGPGAVYHPDFPGGSPFITVVGGTDFVTKGTIGAEKVWTAGGGGFSNTFGIPEFQADAVAGYLKDAGAQGLLPPQSKWNATGRAYPDVAALGGQGNPYCIIVAGSFAGVAGTSASCPVVAGVFAKLNEIRLAAGKPPLGHLNPLIYKIGAQGFNDVTQGSNCGKPACKANDGFAAIKGWDPATGWGTPNFEALKTLV